MQYGIEIVGDLSEQCPPLTTCEAFGSDGGECFEINTDDLAPLGIAFREFLWNRIPEDEEWDSTSAFMNYVSMDVVSIDLRGVRPKGRTQIDWCLEIFFSGCAGTSELSSELAAHWADLWYGHNRREIDDTFLVPFGFIPAKIQKETCWPRFVPIQAGSYAAFDPTMQIDDEDSPFTVDVAFADSQEDGGQNLLIRLNQVYGELVQDGECRCQLCMPEFEPLEVLVSNE